MNVGDKVCIKHSPYYSVKNGTTGYIVKILFKEYGRNWTVYILDTKPCSTFKEYEIEKIEEEKP